MEAKADADIKRVITAEFHQEGGGHWQLPGHALADRKGRGRPDEGDDLPGTEVVCLHAGGAEDVRTVSADEGRADTGGGLAVGAV